MRNRWILGPVAAAAVIAAVVMAVAGDTDDRAHDVAGPDAGATTEMVPAAWADWYRTSAQQCDVLSAALLAAQGRIETGYDQQAVSLVGAEGPAMLLPATWRLYGRDDDRNGATSPYDLGDAIMAQGRFLCALATTIDAQLASGAVDASTHPGGKRALILAAYHGGVDAVHRSRGVPAQSRTYVDAVVRSERELAGGQLTE